MDHFREPNNFTQPTYIYMMVRHSINYIETEPGFLIKNSFCFATLTDGVF